MKKKLIVALVCLMLCSGALLLTACGPKSFTVTFETFGLCDDIEPIVVAKGEKLISPPSPVSTDAAYTFDSWLNQFGSDFRFDREITEDTKIVVRWAHKDFHLVYPSGTISIYRVLDKTKTSYELPALPQATEISEDCFKDCVNLTDIVIPPNITEIGASAFANCVKLETVVIPDTVTKIGRLFPGCTALKNVTLPSGLTEIDDRFGTSIGLFSDCTSLQTVTLPAGLLEIDYNMFYGCTALTEIIIPESVIKIETFAFAGCRNLLSVSFPSSLTKIESAAFRQSGLRAIYFFGGALEIERVAFENCQYLEIINIEAPLSQGVIVLGANAFSTGVSSTAVRYIYLPDAQSVAAYQAAENWSAYADKIKIGH